MTARKGLGSIFRKEISGPPRDVSYEICTRMAKERQTFLYQYASTVFRHARRKYTNEIKMVSRAPIPAISSSTD
jgi:hypothetical protein